VHVLPARPVPINVFNRICLDMHHDVQAVVHLLVKITLEFTMVDQTVVRSALPLAIGTRSLLVTILVNRMIESLSVAFRICFRTSK
jgi:hypothetical protein